MNIFAGNFSLLEDAKKHDLDFDIIEISPRNYYIMGGDENISSSKELLQILEQHIGKITDCDISITTEDSLEVLMCEYEEGSYECVTFEGPNIEFEDIRDRFLDAPEALCVRQAENSKKYDNKVVKVDFMY